MKNRIIIAAIFTACLALCAAVWPQAEKVEKPPAPSETTAVTTLQPTLPEPDELILQVITEKQESGVLKAESTPEVAAEEVPALPLAARRKCRRATLFRMPVSAASSAIPNARKSVLTFLASRWSFSSRTVCIVATAMKSVRPGPL